MSKFNYVHVNLTTEEYNVVEYNMGDFLGPIDVGIHLHLDIYQSYKQDVYDPNNVVVLGKGPFAYGGVFGAHRMVFVFRSPLSKGIHVSAVGGAAYQFMRTGLDGVVIEGKSRKPTILFIWGLENGLKVEFKYMNFEELFRIYKEGFDQRIGVRGLAKYLLNKYYDSLAAMDGRMFIVGPASFTTSMGGICSPTVDYMGRRLKVEEWAARGGGGSVLARAHNLIALICGGVKPPRESKLGRFEFINALATTKFHEPYIRVLTEGTSKYSYDKEAKTGGTFGSNILIYRNKIPAFNWRSVLIEDDKLKSKIYEQLVLNYLEPFNKEIIERGIWRTCGEPCPVQCKKTIENGDISIHLDYEPMNAAGPMIGILSFKEALEVLNHIDELGFDAIEIGNVMGWLFELLERRLLKPEDINVEGIPVMEPQIWQSRFSQINKEIALKVLDEIVYGDNKLLRRLGDYGLRALAKSLDEELPDRIKEYKFEDLAVYAGFGIDGYMTPNFYWTPGVLAPLPILGKYWTYYTPSFASPEDFASITLNRALIEYLVENAGWCRFHRSWVEKVLPELYKILGVEKDLLQHAKLYYKKLLEYRIKAGAPPVYWESKRVLELLKKAACEFKQEEWCRRFSENLEESAKLWWIKFNEVFTNLLST